jgi:hypothetical protein
MPSFTGTNVAWPSRMTNTPSVSSRAVARLQFERGVRGHRGLHARTEAEARLRGTRRRDDVALLVVDQLTDAERLNRHGHRLFARGGGDLGRAGEAGADVGDLLVECDHDLEVGRRSRAGGGCPGGLDRAVADLGDLARERAVRDGVDRDPAGWPICTSGMSVSSTSISASMIDMSATVSSTVPGLFIVPTTTLSPSSMLRRVTMPSNGASNRDLRKLCWLLVRPASCCCSCSSRVRTSCSRARRSLSRASSSACVFSSVSRVVRPASQSSSWRLRFCLARARSTSALLDADARLFERRPRGGDAPPRHAARRSRPPPDRSGAETDPP